MELGAIISEKRKQVGLTIDELAEKSGVPKSTLNKIINGYTRNPQIETVVAIAKALHCTLNDFYDFGDDSITTDEQKLIRQFRQLDSTSQEVVYAVLAKELEREQNCLKL